MKSLTAQLDALRIQRRELAESMSDISPKLSVYKSAQLEMTALNARITALEEKRRSTVAQDARGEVEMSGTSAVLTA